MLAFPRDAKVGEMVFLAALRGRREDPAGEEGAQGVPAPP